MRPSLSSLTPCATQSGGDPAALDDFEGRFKGVHFYKGMEMIFTNTKRGDLVLRLDGKEVGWLFALQHPICGL